MPVFVVVLVAQRPGFDRVFLCLKTTSEPTANHVSTAFNQGQTRVQLVVNISKHGVN
jgi:hypothetical protein